jgi:hypothetical protein
MIVGHLDLVDLAPRNRLPLGVEGTVDYARVA